MLFLAVRIGVPKTDSAVLTTRDEQGHFRVKRDGSHVLSVTLQRVDACFGLVVENLGRVIVGTRENKRLISTKVDAIDPLGVDFQ